MDTPNPHLIDQLTTLFGAMADPSRAQILLALYAGDKRSGDLANLLAVTHSAVSHQMRWLREKNLVASHKEGREVYYSLSDECIRQLIEIALKHIGEK
jgi:ArsR family transcriptional regulator, lead/cadmium/zinc/bismuth-responsive transcriptional repressor